MANPPSQNAYHGLVSDAGRPITYQILAPIIEEGITTITNSKSVSDEYFSLFQKYQIVPIEASIPSIIVIE
jgi:hypothetical protein